MKHCFLLLTLIVLSTTAYAQPVFQLGVNLDNANAFVNVVSHTARYSRAIGYDSLGWPMSNFDLVLLDARPATEWANSIDDPDQYRVDVSGRYASQFTGRATVAASGTSVAIENSTYNPNTNTTTFDVVVGAAGQANHGMVFLTFTNTQRTSSSPQNSGITKLVVNRPGYALTATQTFTDEYLRLCQAANFACYRFYNVQNIWEGEPVYPARTRWNQRKLPTDAAQVSMAGTSGKRDAWCWEHILELSNILKKDVWICVHMSADSAYVASLATMLKKDLDASLNIYVESSNEVWSPTQATHGPYNAAEASSRGVTFDDNHAHRTVLLSRWFASVFGQGAINNRIRVIMAGQQGYHGRSDNHLRYIQRIFAEPRTLIYATSSTVYFGSTNEGSTNPVEINNGMIADINNQISNPNSGVNRLNHINKATQWQLVGGVTSYEGGPHLPAGGGTANLANQIRSHRTPEMADVLKRNYLEGWRDIGGGLAMYFAQYSGYNRYGCWGITDDPSKPDRNYKMQALRDIIGPSTSVNESEVLYQLLTISYNTASQTARIVLQQAPSSQLQPYLANLIGQTTITPYTQLDPTTLLLDVSNIPQGLYVVHVGALAATLLIW